ncbi:MAG: IS481 family transposase [Hyphomicrobiaceae bacterium]|nr:IS481 family transposase [Hyphomicrobiaceae bacterium]
MNILLHKNATTTPRIREEIRNSDEPNHVLAERYNITVPTVAKWKTRDNSQDLSHRPNNLQTTLNKGQEAIVVELRKSLLLPLDDLVAVVREFISEQASRSAIDRLLRRHKLSNLNEMKRERLALENENTGEKQKKKTFKDYDPGFIHIDIKYLPQMKGESSRKYLLVAIDRATRWVYLEVVNNKSAKTAAAFLKRLVAKAPFAIEKILTDNGKEFIDRFTPNGEREPTGKHAFDKQCTAHKIEHRLIKPRHPQTNGMVERFNGRISDILKTTHFNGAENLKQTMERYMRIYNHHIPQRALGHVAPIEALKQWQKKKPDLFKKRVYDLSGLDN